MCLVIAFVFLGVAYNFFINNNFNLAILNGAIGVFFIILMIRNISLRVKAKKIKKSLKQD